MVGSSLPSALADAASSILALHQYLPAMTLAQQRLGRGTRQEAILYLRTLARSRSCSGEKDAEFKANAYSDAADTLAAMQRIPETQQELLAIKGIGPSISEKLAKYMETGKPDIQAEYAFGLSMCKLPLFTPKFVRSL
jgi:DNA polymerase/3'-5' exonuclease PolX